MIELQPFGADTATRDVDYARLIDWINATSPAFMVQWAGLAFHFPLSASQLDRYVRGYEYGRFVPREVFKAVRVDDGSVVGHIELNNVRPERDAATICRVLIGETNTRGHGYGQAMMRSMVDYAFETHPLRRLDLYVFDFNISAITCYERVGFRRSRFLRNVREVNGESWSAFQMSLLRINWNG